MTTYKTQEAARGVLTMIGLDTKMIPTKVDGKFYGEKVVQDVKSSRTTCKAAALKASTELQATVDACRGGTVIAEYRDGKQL